MSPYELIFGKNTVSPLDIEAATYLGIDWYEFNTAADLLKARADQLLRREEILDESFGKMM